MIAYRVMIDPIALQLYANQKTRSIAHRFELICPGNDAKMAKHGASRLSPSVRGVLAGAAGTVALNLATYSDMALRARSSSDMPTQLVLALAKRWQIGALLDEGDEQQKEAASNRREAVGALLGYVNGLGLPLLSSWLRPHGTSSGAGLLLGIGAMAASDTPAVVLGVTDPRTWGLAGWLSDAIPHLAYGIVAAATYKALSIAAQTDSG